MNPRLLALMGTLVLVLGFAGGAVWWVRQDRLEAPPPADSLADDLPVPPVPPRITDDDQYDKCMTMIADDPEGAEAIATSWQAMGGGARAG